MKQWTDRAMEEANLFNPAFCSTLLAQAAQEHDRKVKRQMPFAIAVLVLPIVLHRGTREALPHSTVSSLLPWIQDNRTQVVDFARRVNRLLPITREAIQFGVSHKILALSSKGHLSVGDKHLTPTEKRTSLFTAEARDCVDRAGFLGRWLAVAGTTATIYAAWGIAP